MNEFKVANVGDIIKLMTRGYLPGKVVETILQDNKVLVNPIQPYHFIFPVKIVVENGNLEYNVMYES